MLSKQTVCWVLFAWLGRATTAARRALRRYRSQPDRQKPVQQRTDFTMSEIERTKQKIAAITAKRDAAGDPESRWYYDLCLAGWRAELRKLEAGKVYSVGIPGRVECSQ